jgi:curved DNA-binding protein CbpA
MTRPRGSPQHNGDVDPHAVLGVDADASPDEVTAAYRRQAKRWHPDRVAGAHTQLKMAEVNAAYELLRADLWQQRRRDRPASRTPGPRGSWLPDAVRRALGAELLRALDEGEPVRLVTPAATWASPHTLLVVTDRRLLWLLDDAPVHRVRSLRFRDIADIAHRPGRLRRETATLQARTRTRRRIAFAELRPDTAAAVARHVEGYH